MRLLAPGDAPPWAVGFARDIEKAIRDARDAPLCLQGLVTTNLPPAADYPQGMVYDHTANRPTYSDGSGWRAWPTSYSDLGLGTASLKNIGIAGDAVPLLNTAVSWSVSFSATTAQISFAGTGGNWINMGQEGISAPAFTTRATGTRIVLYPAVSGSATDYALGVDTGTAWMSVANSSAAFKWYQGITVRATLDAAGLDVVGAIRGDSLRIDATPSPSAASATHKVPVNLNGTIYFLLLSNV